MVNFCILPGLSGGGLRQGSIGFKEISELTDDKTGEDDLINVVCIAKAKIGAF